jgi:hypothetical protein
MSETHLFGQSVLVFSSPKMPFFARKSDAANVLAANVMDIRSFAALKKASGAWRR